MVYDHRLETTCGKCSAVNHVGYRMSGDSRANQDRESAECFGCGHEVASEKCYAIFAEESEAALDEAFKRLSKGFT